MSKDNSGGLPKRITDRVQDEPVEYLFRDERLEERYRYGDEADSEPVKAIEKEIDGMARLLCALTADEGITTPTSALLNVYEQEVAHLRDLQDEVVSELPERTEDE